jgi:hypothetical protein
VRRNRRRGPLALMTDDRTLSRYIAEDRWESGQLDAEPVPLALSDGLRDLLRLAETAVGRLELAAAMVPSESCPLYPLVLEAKQAERSMPVDAVYPTRAGP